MADELMSDKKNKYLGQLKKYFYQFFPVVVVLIFLLISFIGYRFVLSPKYDNINNEIKKSIEARVENKELLGRYLQRLSKYEENYNNISKLNKEKVFTFFNYGYDSEILFSQFEAIADSQGIILNSLSVLPESEAKNLRVSRESVPKSDGGLQTAKISANFVGLDYVMLKTFLAFFESTLPLINITNLKFTDGNVVVIEAETYYLN